MFLELRDGRPRVRIVAVSHHVSLVDAGNGIEHFRMNARIVITGKTARGLYEYLWHKKTM
jgi:glutamine cyclotransferase